MIGARLVLGVGSVAAIAGALGGWTARDWKADSDELAQRDKVEAQREKDRAKWDLTAEKFEQALADMRGAEITDRNTIREIYREVKVPAECAPPPAAVSLLNDAVDRANAAASGEPAPAVRPAPEPAPAVP